VTSSTTPISLNLQRDKQLEIQWQDGTKGIYTIGYLRSMCPCAKCRTVRSGENVAPAGEPRKKSLLTVLPGNYSKPLQAVSAELIGNYALRIEWSDDHASGIYSFSYLREICPK
jgi:DUF971 family protein